MGESILINDAVETAPDSDLKSDYMKTKQEVIELKMKFELTEGNLRDVKRIYKEFYKF